MKFITSNESNDIQKIFVDKDEVLEVYGNGTISVYGHGTVNIHDEVTVFDNDTYGDCDDTMPENWYVMRCTLLINAYDHSVIYGNGNKIILHDNAECK